MTFQQLLYLAQLEQYDRERISLWLKTNPGRVVEEKKHHLDWTMKVRLLFVFASIYSMFLPKEKAVLAALSTLEPFDILIKHCVMVLATLKLQLFHPDLHVIGIAGSWGKTTTKETLAEILRTKWRVCTTKDNTNTVMGIALTILRLPLHCQIFICEMDAWIPGEIAKVCRLICPEVGIVTTIGPMHLERFHDDYDALVRAQMELIDAIPKDGLAYKPTDGNDGVLVNTYKEIAKRFMVPEENADHILRNPPEVQHRAQIIEANGISIIDDAYNANPAGFRRALKKLEKLKAKKRILVTPGMIEMGARQFTENEAAAQEAAQICDIVIVVGEENKQALMVGAKKAKKLVWVRDLEEAKSVLAREATAGSAVLFENDLPDHYF